MADSHEEGPLTYERYLKITELLKLQQGSKNAVAKGDELHFIIVHQIFELWFRLLRSELSWIRDAFDTEHVKEQAVADSVRGAERCIQILKVMREQWAAVGTLEPQGFLKFRHELGSASGFESWQMRVFELMIGYRQEERPDGSRPLDHLRKASKRSSGDSAAWGYIEKELARPSIAEVVARWLHRTPIHGSTPQDSGDVEVVTEFLKEVIASITRQSELGFKVSKGGSSVGDDILRARHEAVLSSATSFFAPDGVPNRARLGLYFIETFRDAPLLAWPQRLIDTLVQLEEGVILWRTHHARTVERIIGRRPGTGGSSGVDYLDQTLKMRAFTDLWTVRSLLSPSDFFDTEADQTYGFAIGG